MLRAISSWMAKTSSSWRSKRSAQTKCLVETSTSCAVILTRLPERRMEPSRTYAAPSCSPTCSAVIGLSRNARISARGKISNCLIFQSSVRMSSVMPSRKYSSSFEPL